jgi:Carboxypeptidase regulatory-like domain
MQRSYGRKVSNRAIRAVLLVCVVLGTLSVLGLRQHRVLSDRASRHRGAEPRDEAAASLLEVAPRPASLSGTVRADNGKPIAAAGVCATDVGSAWLGTEHPVCSESDAAGHYLISGLPPGRFSVAAEAEGFMPTPPDAQPQVALGPGDDRAGFDLELVSGGAKIEGFVMDATGGPVPGAVVRGSGGMPLRPMAVSTCGDNGHFVLWVAPGTVTLTAEAAGYASELLAHVAPSRDVIIVLTPGSTIEGHVVALGDRAPVPNVAVRAVPMGMWPSPALPSDVSRDDGRFSIRGLEPGAYRLVAEGDGWRGGAAEPIEIGVTQVVGPVQVTVSAATHVIGRVVRRSDGTLCEQGVVTLGPADGMPGPFDPPSDDSEPAPSAPPHPLGVPVLIAAIGSGGGVAFRSVPPGTYHVTIQSLDLQLVDGPRTLTVPAAGVDDAIWKMDVGLGMVIHVVDEADRAVPNGAVRILWPQRRQTEGPLTMPVFADAEGKYRVPQVLYPGVYRLEPGGGYQGTPVDVDLRDGMGEVDAKLRLHGRGSIVATVTTIDGAPLDNVTMTATLVSDPATHATSGDAGTSGASAPPFVVPGRRSGVALGGGRFRIGPLDDGTYGLEATDGVNPPAPAAGSPSATVRVAGGANVEVDIALDRGAAVRGRVVDEARQAVPDAWVSASCRDPGKAPSVDSPFGPPAASRALGDAEGHFVLRNLAAGAECTLRAEQPYGPAAVLQGVHPGDADVVVVLPTLATVQGTATGPDGRAEDQVTLTLRETSTGRAQTVRSTDGHFRFTKVVPGHQQLRANDAAGNTGRTEFDLASGASLDGVQLELRSLQAANKAPLPPSAP